MWDNGQIAAKGLTEKEEDAGKKERNGKKQKRKYV